MSKTKLERALEIEQMIERLKRRKASLARPRKLRLSVQFETQHEKEARPLAIFHSHIQIISRGKGKSAVAAAAYRAGAIITNEYDGITHDYTRKGGVVHTEIMLPDNAPEQYRNRAALWNAVEKVEKAKNAQLARELDIALPIELSRDEQINLAREYVKNTFVSVGMCTDLCVHDTGNGNPHFHVMLTMRPINEDGGWGAKQRKEYILDSTGNKIYDMADLQNKLNAMRSELHIIKENSKKLDRRITVLNERLAQSENLKKHRNFKQRYEKLYAQYETARKETGLGAKRKAEKALAAANDYYESYRLEITLFNAADKYMRGILQSHYRPGKLPPIKKWGDELMSKITQLNMLAKAYQTLTDETRKVEEIKRNVSVVLTPLDQTHTEEKSARVTMRGVER